TYSVASPTLLTHVENFVCYTILCSTLPLPPNPSLFPYTTLFRSPKNHHNRTITQKQQPQPPKNRPHHHPSIPTIRPRHHTPTQRSEEHTSELQSRFDLVCRLLLEKKQTQNKP